MELARTERHNALPRTKSARKSGLPGEKGGAHRCGVRHGDGHPHACRVAVNAAEYGCATDTPQPLAASLRDASLRPDQDHPAPAVQPLVLNGGAEHVGIDLDREYLLRDQ